MENEKKPRKQAKRQSPAKRALRTYVGPALITAMIAGTAAIIGSWIQRPNPLPPAQPAGKITAPLPKQTVPRKVAVEGTLSAIPPERHVWVAVQVGNLQWPKEPEIPRQNQRWRREVSEEGLPPKGSFSLVLLMVDQAGQAEIEAWLERGHRAHDFPPLKGIPGAVELDVVGDLVLQPEEKP